MIKLIEAEESDVLRCERADTVCNKEDIVFIVARLYDYVVIYHKKSDEIEFLTPTQDTEANYTKIGVGRLTCEIIMP